MLPTVRVLVERAASARYQLAGLIAVLPPAMFDHRAAGDDWTVRTHTVHALGSDALSLEFLEGGATADFASWLHELPARRAAAIASSAGTAPADLLERAQAARAALVTALAQLTPAELQLSAALPGMRTAWGDERRITLYEYLLAWSSHDGAHEQAIRLAILSRPDLSAVALTRRRR